MKKVTLRYDQIRHIIRSMGLEAEDADSFIRAAEANPPRLNLALEPCPRCGISDTHHPLCEHPDGTTAAISDDDMRAVIEWMRERALEVHQGIPA